MFGFVKKVLKKKSAPGDHSAQVLDAAMSIASGNETSLELPDGVVASSNFVANKFLQVDITGPKQITQAVLMRIGRDYIEKGFSRWHLANDILLPIISATKIKNGWSITIPNDDTSTSLNVLDEQVLNVVFRQDHNFPWRGVPPWKASGVALAQRLDGVMSDEAGGDSGQLMVAPLYAAKSDEDAVKKELTLKKSVFNFRGKERGKLKVLHNSSGSDVPELLRLGPAWPDSLERTRAQLFKECAACCGIPVECLIGGAAGSIREGHRSWAITAQGILNLIAGNMADFFGEAVELDASPLFKLDLISRSRAAGSLSNAGVSTDEALRLTGFK